MMELPCMAEKYINDMSLKGTWGDGIVIDAAVNFYKRPIIVVTPDSQHTHGTDIESSIKPMRLGFINNNHYVSLKPLQHLPLDDQKPLTTIPPVPSLEVDDISTYSTENIVTTDTPFHPTASIIPPQCLQNGKRMLHFQSQWFDKYPLLHYCIEKKAVICFTCAKAEALKLTNLAKKREPVFVTDGFRNWKKGIEKFDAHALSSSHVYSVSQLSHCTTAQPVNQQLCTQQKKAQSDSRSALHVICTSVKFLARQGLALRGHKDTEG